MLFDFRMTAQIPNPNSYVLCCVNLCAMVLREPKDHCNNCYFSAVKAKGINRKNRNCVTYPNLCSAIRPVPHSEELPVPVFESLPQLESSFSSEEEDVSTDNDNILADNNFPRLFYLIDLARALNLSKESSELMTSKLKEKNHLKKGTFISFCWKYYAEFLP